MVLDGRHGRQWSFGTFRNSCFLLGAFLVVLQLRLHAGANSSILNEQLLLATRQRDDLRQETAALRARLARRRIADEWTAGAGSGEGKGIGDAFRLAADQSYGFFDDVPEEHWRRLREIFLANRNHYDPARPLQFSQHDPKKNGDAVVGVWNGSPHAYYQNHWEPNFACQFERRIGAQMNGDGPKWVCDPHRIRRRAAERKARDPESPGCVVYSVGSNGDFNFELGMQEEVGVGTCEFHIFDMGYYEHLIPAELERAHYHRWGLKVGEPAVSNNWYSRLLGAPPALPPKQMYYSLSDTVKLLGHGDLDVIDIFKIDCEKCEWETYRDWLKEDIPMLHQIQVEVHGVEENSTVDFFDHLQASGYATYHKEPNIQYDPGCIEYGFVKMDPAFVEGKDVTL